MSEERETGRLVVGLERSRAEVALLRRVLHLFGAPDDFDRVFEGLLEAVLDFFQAPAGSVYMIDAERDELYVAAARGPRAAELLELDPTLAPGEGLAGCSFQDGEVIAISDAHRDPRFSREIAAKVGYEVRSVLCIPIVCDGEPFGVVQVLNRGQASSFTRDEVELARQVGRYAGSLVRVGLELEALRAGADGAARAAPSPRHEGA